MSTAEIAHPKPAASRKVGLIGFGYWGQKLARAIADSSAFQLKKVHVRHPELLSQSERASLGDVPVTSRREELLGDPELEALVIASPISTHYRLCKEALESCKHILVEKPLTLSGKHATELAREARARGLTLQTDYTWTFSPGLEHAQQQLNQQRIGKLLSVQLRFQQLGRFRSHGVGPLLIVHMLAIAAMFVDLQRIQWRREDRNHRGDLITATRLTGASDDGVELVLEASLENPDKQRQLQLIGSLGRLDFDPLSSSSTVSIRRPRGSSPQDLKEVTESPFYSEESNNLGRAIDAFAATLAGERTDNLELSVTISCLLERLFSAGQEG